MKFLKLHYYFNPRAMPGAQEASQPTEKEKFSNILENIIKEDGTYDFSKLNKWQKGELINFLINQSNESENFIKKTKEMLHDAQTSEEIKEDLKNILNQYYEKRGVLIEQTQDNLLTLGQEYRNEGSRIRINGEDQNLFNIERRVNQKGEDINNFLSREQFDEKGNITSDYLRSLMSNLDGDGGVEVQNRGIFQRLFTGTMNMRQSQIIGEQQMSHALMGKSDKQLNELFLRISGQEILPISSQDVIISEREYKGHSGVDISLKPEITNKIKNFQLQFLEEVEAVANTLSLLSGKTDLRAGMTTVIDGNSEAVFKKLQTPEGQEAVRNALSKGEIAKEDISKLNKVVDFLFKIGIAVPVSLLIPGGQIRTETTENKIPENLLKESSQGGEKGKNIHTELNLTNIKMVAHGSGKNSAAVNVDLGGLTLEANVNDHSTIIRNANIIFANTPDKSQAVENVVQFMTKINESKGEKWNKAQKTALDILTNSYKKQQQDILNQKNLTPEQQEVQKRLLLQNTNTYASKIQELKGFEFKGAYATLGFTSWAAGLNFTKTHTGGTREGVNSHSAEAEAALNVKEISNVEVEKLLTSYGFMQGSDGSFIIGAEKIKPSPGKQIQWNITELFFEKSKELKVEWKEVDKSIKTPSTITSLNMSNHKEVNAYIQKNPQQVAEFLLKIRGNIVNVQQDIVDGNYDSAKIKLQGILSKNYKNNPAATALLNEINTAQGFGLQVLLDELLAKTSGGRISREMAQSINEGKTSGKDVMTYYTKENNRILNKFSAQYGIDSKSILPTLEKISKNINKDTISTLGNYAPNGFTAMVAYSQVNWEKGKSVQGLERIDRVISSHAQIIGQPEKVSDDIADKMRTMMKAKISDAEITEIIKNNSVLQGKSPDEIRTLMTSGEVKAYLSFEPYAECFNLGFMIEPGKIEIPGQEINVSGASKWGRGSGILELVSNSNDWGLGMGAEYEKKPKSNEGANEEPHDSSTEPKPDPEQKTNPPPTTETPPATPETPKTETPPTTQVDNLVTTNSYTSTVSEELTNVSGKPTGNWALNDQSTHAAVLDKSNTVEDVVGEVKKNTGDLGVF